MEHGLGGLGFSEVFVSMPVHPNENSATVSMNHSGNYNSNDNDNDDNDDDDSDNNVNKRRQGLPKLNEIELTSVNNDSPTLPDSLTRGGEDGL